MSERLSLDRVVEEEAATDCTSEAPKEYKIGDYVILATDEGFSVSKGGEVIGSFQKGEVREDEGKALLELDKGMRLEITPEGHRKIFSPEKAGLHGYACADGTLQCGGYRCKLHGKDIVRYRYALRVRDEDRLYRTLFGTDVKKVYGVELHDDPKRGEACVYGKDMAYDLSKYGPINTHDWRVPFQHLDQEGARMWIRRYFNGDGCPTWDKYHKGVRVTAGSVNKWGLDEVQTLLRDHFDIRSGVYPFRRKEAPPTWSETYSIEIKRREDVLKFRDEIGFDGQKQQKLNELIRKYWGE